MPLQNRVTPLGELVATPERGLVYGNRGRLHNEHGEIRRQWQLKRWISCRLEFRGRHRAGGPMAPGRYTGLFFLDEATALAAGHRPCAECRNPDYRSFLRLTGASGADELDRRCMRNGWATISPAAACASGASRSYPTGRSSCSTARRTSSSETHSCAGHPAATRDDDADHVAESRSSRRRRA
jgi:hypothetical protein